MASRWTPVRRVETVVLGIAAASYVLTYSGLHLVTPIAQRWHGGLLAELNWQSDTGVLPLYAAAAGFLVALVCVIAAHRLHRDLDARLIALVLVVAAFAVFIVPDMPRWFGGTTAFDLDQILAGSVFAAAGALVARPLVRATRWSLQRT